MHSIALCLLVLSVAFAQNSAEKQGKDNTKQNSLINEARFNCTDQICDYVKDYPEDEINKAMANHHTLKSLVDGTVYNTSADSIIMETRNYYDPFDTNQFCKVKGTITHTPRWLRNVNLKWQYVVNTEKYKQLISVEICRNQTEQNEYYCSEEGMSCTQNFQELTLLIYDQKKKIIKFDKFTLPTTCQCSKPKFQGNDC